METIPSHPLNGINRSKISFISDIIVLDIPMKTIFTWLAANIVWVAGIIVVVFSVLAFYLRRLVRPGSDKGEQGTNERDKSSGFAGWAASSIELIIVAIAATFIIITQQGTDLRTILIALRGWLADHGLLVLAIIVASYLAFQLIKNFLPPLIEHSANLSTYGDKDGLARRTQTVSRITVSTLGIVITLTATLMILDEFGFGRFITPLLAGAGIVGVAVGFGAQSLIKDLLNGVFIILEDQYRKGDVVTIADITGLVEDVNLRRTLIRDLDGTVHTIPNSLIETASNLTKEWSRVNLDIPVAYGEDIERAMEIINRVGKELAEDDTFAPMITGTPRAIRIEGFEEHGVIIKVLGVTRPLKQWDVSGEMRKRIKKAFDIAGIELSKPRLKVDYNSANTSSHICKACAAINTPGSRFCSGCGAPLNPVVK